MYYKTIINIDGITMIFRTVTNITINMGSYIKYHNIVANCGGVAGILKFPQLIWVPSILWGITLRY